MKLGSFDVALLSDGRFKLDGGQMFGVVPKALWEKKAPADARNRIHMALNCLLLRKGNDVILVEAGIGDKFNAKYRDIYGIERSASLLDGLKEHGVQLEDVRYVINTHLHFDHCGWNTRVEGAHAVPTFPRARYFVQRGEWEHAHEPSERDRGSYIEEYFHAAGPLTELVDGSQEILPGVSVEVVAGHNRNVQCVWIESGGEKLCFISDLVPTRFHLAFPWIMALDLYPMETLANKKRLLPQLARDRAVIVFPHDIEVPCARLTEKEGGFEAVPVDVNA